MVFQKVSGYRTDRKALTFLRGRSRIMVTFALLGKIDLYSPIYATVSMQTSPIPVRARHCEAID